MSVLSESKFPICDVVDRERSILLHEREWTFRAADLTPLAILERNPVDGPTRDATVILVHGLRGNRYNWNLSSRSFQNAFVELGYSTLCPELRGSGASRRYGNAIPRSILELLELDLIPLIELVTSVTSRPVLLVGHSLGGILSCLAASQLPEKVKAVVALGAPLTVGADQPLVRFGARLWVALSESEAFREVAQRQSTGRILIACRRAMDRLSLNPMNSIYSGSMEPEVEREFALHSTSEPAYPGLLCDMSRLAIGESPAGLDIMGELGRMRAPLLCVAGSRDELAPEGVAKALFDASGSPSKSWVLAGEENAHLGHVDLILGSNAPQLVWSKVLYWLERGNLDGYA